MAREKKPIEVQTAVLIRTSREEREGYQRCAEMAGVSMQQWCLLVLRDEVVKAHKAVNRPLPMDTVGDQAERESQKAAGRAAEVRGPVAYSWTDPNELF